MVIIFFFLFFRLLLVLCIYMHHYACRIRHGGQTVWDGAAAFGSNSARRKLAVHQGKLVSGELWRIVGVCIFFFFCKETYCFCGWNNDKSNITI